MRREDQLSQIKRKMAIRAKHFRQQQETRKQQFLERK